MLSSSKTIAGLFWVCLFFPIFFDSSAHSTVSTNDNEPVLTKPQTVDPSQTPATGYGPTWESLITSMEDSRIASSTSKTTTPNSKGRNQWSFAFDGFSAFTYTDQYKAFYDVPTTNLKNLMYGFRMGFEGVLPSPFGVRLLAGYARPFWANIGVQQIRQNFLQLDLVFEAFLKKAVTKADPYVFAGPQVLVSSAGQQGFLSLGFGYRFFLNNKWSIRVEPAFLTDFDGFKFQFATGISRHF